MCVHTPEQINIDKDDKSDKFFDNVFKSNAINKFENLRFIKNVWCKYVYCTIIFVWIVIFFLCGHRRESLYTDERYFSLYLLAVLNLYIKWEREPIVVVRSVKHSITFLFWWNEKSGNRFVGLRKRNAANSPSSSFCVSGCFVRIYCTSQWKTTY